MTRVNLIQIAENFFNSLFLVFSTFTCGIVIGLLVFGLTMTINVSRAFLFVIIASITASFIRCVYQEADDEVLLARPKSLPIAYIKDNSLDHSSRSLTWQHTNRPTIEMSADDSHYQFIQHPERLAYVSPHHFSYPSVSQQQPTPECSSSNRQRQPVLIHSSTPPGSHHHENSDLISAHSRQTEDESSAMKKPSSNYLVQIYIDFTRNLIYFVENHKNTVRLQHFDKDVTRALPLILPSEDRHKLPHDELNILYAYRIEFCTEPCSKPQFKIFISTDESPIFSLCLHEEHLIVRELRRHILGQNLILQSSRHGNAPFKTIYSGMIKANVKIRDYKDRIFRITVE